MQFASCFVLWLCLAVIGQALAAEGKTAVEDLGNGRYRVGAITIDKTAGQLSVPGTVIKLDQPDSPIEFMAVSKGGMKRYEAIFELDTSAVNFNLACILLGLDASHATQPKHHFDPEPLKGDAVKIFVSWKDGEKAIRVPVSDVLRLADNSKVPNDWVYTGSFFSPDGGYIAEMSGTLVGFVHDPDSIIQHRSGLGLGHYGAVTYNADVLPQPGTPVRLQISRPAPRQ
jgi:hypothetical protein